MFATCYVQGQEGIGLPKNGHKGWGTKTSFKWGRMPKWGSLQKGKIALLKKNKKNLNDINIFQDFKM